MSDSTANAQKASEKVVRNIPPSRVKGGFLVVLAWAICLTPVAWFFPKWLGLSDSHHYGIIALWICTAVTLGCLPWKHSLLSQRFPVISILIPITWRMFAVLAIFVWASATKWPNLNLFAYHLVGYYFLFVALESWLAIKNINSARF